MFEKVEKDCAYCRQGHMLMNEEHVICDVYGLIQRQFKCRHFIYDPLKRVPTCVSMQTDFSAEDFSIE